MDTNENQELQMPQSQPETQQEPAVEPEQEASSYHGQGVGTREEVSPEPAFEFRSYPSQGVYQKPAEAPQAEEEADDFPPQIGKTAKKLRFWKRAVAVAAAVTLVVASCCITSLVTSSSWKKQLDNVTKNFEEKLNVLQDQLNDKANNLGGAVVAPTEGMTPSQLYLQNMKSVVAISCQTLVNNGFGQGYTTSSGSGFVLAETGYIVTNHHVIDGATSIKVVLWNEKEYTAQLVGSDSFNDIALLKIEALNLQPVTIGSSDQLSVGSQVVAIGNALGELSSSLTVGYVSGKDRDVTTDGTILNMIQTDAAINSGNSGGPLFNMRGEVVGITTAKYSGSTSSGASIEGIGFAIPIDDVIGMLEDLRDYGYITGVQMGVMVRNMDPDVADTYGFPMGTYVESVVEGSCAQKAGIQSKDIITEVGGYEIETMNDLTRALRKFKPGQEATVKVWRGGREVLLTIVFDAKTQA